MACAPVSRQAPGRRPRSRERHRRGPQGKPGAGQIVHV